MSDLREAAQQALEALEQDNPAGRTATIAALRAALEQQAEPEPVAWVRLESWKSGEEWPDDCFTAEKSEGLTPLYTALVQDQDWELSAALGWPGGISDPVLDRQTLLQQVARLVERAHGIGEEVWPATR